MQRLYPGRTPPLSAGTWNGFVDTAERYKRGGELGTPGSETVARLDPTIVNVANATGDGLRRGDVVELGQFQLNDLRPEFFWFAGETPDLEANRTAFAVMLRPTPAGKYGIARLIGTCIAYVDVLDEGHQYAELNDGEVVLKSAVSGPVRILHKPDGTGEKECAVALGEKGPTQLIGKANEAIAVGGLGTCRVYRGIPGSEEDTGLDVEAFNRTTAIEAEEWISLTLVDDRYWYVAPLGCPAEE